MVPSVLFLTALLSAPNVVFLSVDTLRADHLGCYGYPQSTSPHLDRFAACAQVFDDCVCEVPLTSPSFGSMLTARFPRMTGTTRNGLRMPDDVPTVAELFQAAGYQTFCVQSNWTLKADLSGLDRGFDVYEDDFHQKRWGIIKPERYADEVTQLALDQLASLDPDRPFFGWIHYSDPHAPYRFHRAYSPSGKPRFWHGNQRKVTAKYDSEVAYTDAHLGRLLDALPRADTYVLFTADHGESLFEHGYLGHGRRIYQAGLRIPLLVAGPDIEPGRTAAPVRAVDIGPTLLGLAGLAPAPGMLGLDLLSGALLEARPRVVETYGGAVPRLPGAKAIMAEKPPQRQGVLLDGWKLILDEHGRPELFRLGADPMEAANLAGQEPDRVDALRAMIERWSSETRRSRAKEAELSAEDIEALEGLGYLE